MDPGFPVGGAPILGGEAPAYDFAKYSQKLHEIDKILGRRGVRLKDFPVPLPGCGLGIQSFILYIMVGQYFQRHLSLATGIAASGTGCGLLVFPPLAKLLIDTYNWRGAILILAGVNLHCLVYACAYRPVPAGYLKERDAASGQKTRSKLLDASLLRVPSMVCVYLSGALALIGE